MNTYLYLSVAPEALIASHLPPAEFGRYLAVGTKKVTGAQAIFFELDPTWRTDALPMKRLDDDFESHADGRPRKSRYISIYRALELVPLDAIGNLHLTTPEGHVLSIAPTTTLPANTGKFHLYQEYCPITPRVVSRLSPEDFCIHITDASRPVNVPKIVFAEMSLDGLAEDYNSENIGNLPYANINHLRECLAELDSKPDKLAKAFVRNNNDHVLYRTVKGGFYAGERNKIKYYPMPPLNELETTYLPWWQASLRAFIN